MNFVNDDICKAEISQNGRTIYLCKVCEKTFIRPHLFSKHMKCGHFLSIYACRKCELMFPELGFLYIHTREYHSEKKYQAKKFQCKDCKYSTNNEALLKTHMRAHAGIKPEICDICEKGFTQHSNMKVHRKRHFKPTVEYFCTECDTIYMFHDVFLSHIRSKEHKLSSLINQIFNVKVAFNCEICNLTSDNIDEVMDHGERCFCSNHLACQICFNKFPLDKTKLREHRKFHREESLMCWECAEKSEKYTNKSSLIVHMTKEHGMNFQRSHVCRYCEMLFENKTDLIEHVKEEHIGQKYRHLPNDGIGRLQCDHPDCQFFTNSFMQLEKHCKTIHKVCNEEKMIGIEEHLSYIPNDSVKIKKTGRPRICNTAVTLAKNDGQLSLVPVITRKPGRQRTKERKDIDKIPRKVGRPRKCDNFEVLQNVN